MTTPRDERMETAGLPAGARSWEEQFRTHEPGWFFGPEPSTVARRLVHFFRQMEIPCSGRLLDLGCGEGRDTVFLAKQGFSVEGVDASPTAVERTITAIRAAEVQAEVLHADAAHLPWQGQYDVVLANQVLPFLGEDALRVLEEIRQHTRPGGWNAIGMFTREEVDWRRQPELFCLEPRELRFHYRDWTLLESSESTVWSPRRAGYLSLAVVIARHPTGRAAAG
ncbi:MAG: class I SAM-dependent methyltransferase [Candidatus Eisenbacteria bacterium]|nr:class I SAM-dependent methyltransferase [Candidatus Eisenbacteria bacterium]